MSLSIQLIEAECSSSISVQHPQPTAASAEEFMQLCHGMVVIFTWSYLERLWQRAKKAEPPSEKLWGIGDESSGAFTSGRASWCFTSGGSQTSLP